MSSTRTTGTAPTAPAAPTADTTSALPAAALGHAAPALRRAGWLAAAALLAVGMTAGMQVARPAITKADPKEHWLTVVVDPAYQFCKVGETTPREIPGPQELVREAQIRPTPALAGIQDCYVWMIWVPVSVQSSWTEVDSDATSMAWVRKGDRGRMDARPMQLTYAEGTKRRWHWGGDRKAPDGSEWRQLISSPVCACCTPNCFPADNPEAAKYGIGIELHTRSYQPKVDWKQAAALPWVKPDESLQVFLQSSPYLQFDNPPVQKFVAAALGGKAARDRSPWQTALLLAKSAAAQASPKPYGEAPDMVRGLTLVGAQSFAATGNGNANDAHCLAVAAMRSVGIPARVVLGFQVIPDDTGMTFPAKMATWGEFWIGSVGWIPRPEVWRDAHGLACFGQRERRGGWLWRALSDTTAASHGRTSWTPFKLAAPREYPAGIGLGPLFTSLDDVPDEVLVNYPQQGGADKALARECPEGPANHGASWCGGAPLRARLATRQLCGLASARCPRTTPLPAPGRRHCRSSTHAG